MKRTKTSNTFVVCQHVDERSYMECSLNMWQRHFNRIYGKKNQNLKPEEIWFRVFENASKVAEHLRRYKYAAAFQSLAHVTCWLFGFVNQVGKDMEDVVWRKYPYICPYCRKEKENLERPCSCGTKKAQLEEAPGHIKENMILQDTIRYYSEIFKSKKPSRLDDWVLMFAKLYGNVTYSMPIEHIGFHLMEEIGEVSCVLRRKKEFERRVEQGLEAYTDVRMARQQFEHDLDSELADVFSWTCTLVFKLQSLAKALQDFQDDINDMKGGWNRGRIRIEFPHSKPTDITFDMPESTFSSVLYWEYGKGCPNCKGIPCKEKCFSSECKFMIKGDKCGFDWSQKNKCCYGKLQNQSYICGQT